MTALQTIEQTLPDWLAPVPQSEDICRTQSPNKAILAELNNLAFENMFEGVLVKIATGKPLTQVLEEDYRQPEYEFFLRWIHRDETRKARFYEAQEMAAHVIEAQMLKIADADDSLEDVARSTLRINTRKWLLGVWNRKRFGETKQIDHNVTVDLGAAMAAAQARVDSARTVDVEAREVGRE